MRIGIDARFLTHPQRGGFKTYTEHLVQALERIDHENEYVLYVDRPPQETDLVPRQKNFVARVVRGTQPFYGMPWREQVSLVRHLRRDRLDVFHAPCLSAPLLHSVPMVVTIHDMIWSYPTRYSAGNRNRLMEWYYRIAPLLAARRARAIITVSNASKQSIVDLLKIDSRRIFVTYAAAKDIYRPTKDTKPFTGDASKEVKYDYVLGIGSADPRKNIRTLIHAYSKLPRDLMEKYHLVIVWTHASLASETLAAIQGLQISEYVHFLYDVGDPQLVSLYNRATLFVFPSLDEGFGLPPLEAMACGTPVIAADNSSIPEIVGSAALLFPAKNVETLAELIQQVLRDTALQSQMRSRGLERATQFSWEKCATQTLHVYQEVAHTSTGR